MWLQRPVVACLLLLTIYAVLSVALNDPRGTLGTDTGGKLATLHMMERNGGFDPDVGYWAKSADPTETLHPLFYTFEVDGKSLNATTLPMLYAAYPLYILGGDRAVLFLPMLGAVLCALAGRALARRLGARTGWLAFWAIGLTTPVAIYALDFWEHSIGLALMLWGFVLLYDVAERKAGLASALVGGALFGAAATMRTEAVVYFAVTAASVCIVTWCRRRSFARACVNGLSMLAGAAAVLALNQVLEYATVGGSIRAARAAGTAGEAGTSPLTRVREALTTLIGVKAGLNFDLLFGVVVVALVVCSAWFLGRADEERRPVIAIAALGTAACLIGLRFAAGLGFVPGLLTASPFAAIGLCLGWRRRTSLPLVVATVALPIVWAVQYSGGAGPQWGGRYELLSGALLAVVGLVVLEGKRQAVIGVVVVSALVTAFGVAWLSQRSHAVADAMTTILARHDQAVISIDAHALREGGAFYDSSDHWLTAVTRNELNDAVRLVRESGSTEFALIAADGDQAPVHLHGFTRRGSQKVAFLGPNVPLRIITYRR